VLLMEIMKTSDHSAGSIVVPQGVAIDPSMLINCKSCLSITNVLISNTKT